MPQYWFVSNLLNIAALKVQRYVNKIYLTFIYYFLTECKTVY